MDTIIDKLLEAIKDKLSKKQIIAIVAMVVLAVLKPTTIIELIVAILITLVAIVAISWQGYLEKGEKNVEKDVNSDVPAGDYPDRVQ